MLSRGVGCGCGGVRRGSKKAQAQSGEKNGAAAETTGSPVEPSARATWIRDRVGDVHLRCHGCRRHGGRLQHRAEPGRCRPKVRVQGSDEQFAGSGDYRRRFRRDGRIPTLARRHLDHGHFVGTRQSLLPEGRPARTFSTVMGMFPLRARRSGSRRLCLRPRQSRLRSRQHSRSDHDERHRRAPARAGRAGDHPGLL